MWIKFKLQKMTILFIICIALMGYLFYALINPEKF
ncbi:MAG: K(+)-transporting ATPase subunit F [Ignavibacteria bacterium]|nr:K(+)-transporting ATPase subunit F [Ignavibacteria bacterium]MBK6772002.1 K(+)-transporting ATPase subunit F [Ignavibacteria bacterium]MBK7157215.1 K(+)-transporting ATPase subunit F [Ignavibacteria bacterium]MBK7256155.1 K(+)-transporting ATPase subunit F [Ignavibacteria bacterium]MBK7444622.1 K(+)-transporting ATPase subunit F [Ignavibacteria bacterium]